MQAETGQSNKRQGKKRKASPTTPLSMPVVKTSPSSSAAEACTQQLWEGSSDGEAGPLPVPAAAEPALAAPAQAEAAVAPLQTSVAEVPTENGCAEHHVGAPAEDPELPAAGAAGKVEVDGEAPSTVQQDAVAAPPVEVDAAPANVEMASVAEDASPASDDVQPAAAETQAVLDGLIEATEGSAAVEVDGSGPLVEAAEDDEEEADEGDEGAEEASEEEAAEDKEWPPQGSSLAAEAALLPGRTQYVRKVYFPRL